MKKAYTLFEALIVLIIVSFIAVVLINNLKSKEMSESAYKKMGASMYSQIDYAFRRMLMRNSSNLSMEKLKELTGGQFSVTSSGADLKLIGLCKFFLTGRNSSPLSASYKTSTLKDSSGTAITGYSVSSFSQGFHLKNKSYFAIKLNGNCATNETNIYSPQMPSVRTASRSCGLIFFDVNGEKAPNILGIDQYIVSIGKMGLK